MEWNMWGGEKESWWCEWVSELILIWEKSTFVFIIHMLMIFYCKKVFN
jgi:hypothetical protein